MIERTIILHYHLFKNAGTSVDATLKRNFGNRWVTREFHDMGGNNTHLVERWIAETPDAIVYSSHTMMGPIPVVSGVRVISLLLLRDPIDRIRSAYNFERRQVAETWGARLAKECDFAGYIQVSLAQGTDRNCRNFQTYRLASIICTEGTELERATQALGKLTVVGRVEEFELFIDAMSKEIQIAYPDFVSTYERENVGNYLTISENYSIMKLLADHNKDDSAIILASTREPPLSRRSDDNGVK